MTPVFDINDAITLEKKLHPDTQPQDILKLIIQANMGAMHMIEDETKALQYLKEEKKLAHHKEQLQPIGNGYVRVPLSMMDEKDLSLWNHLFVCGANHSIKNDENVRVMIQQMKLTDHFSSTQINYALQHGIHHSQIYANTYHPHYRILPKVYVDFFPVYQLIHAIIQKQSHACFMIDGCCASGKTTLADTLSQLFPVTLFHMDDYFLTPAQRNKKRLSTPGGNVDYERFDKEILSSIKNQKDIIYQPYDCKSQSLREKISVKYPPYAVVEGSYAHHPYFHIDAIKIFVYCDRKVQLQRIKQRSPYLYDRFVKEWIPMEDTYFQTFDIKNQSDLVIDTTTF